MISLKERQADGEEALRTALDGHAAQMWTALPGIITGFNPTAMTCSVQPAIQGTVTGQDGTQKRVNLPLLVDCPVVFPRGGEFVMTFPVRAGDACLIVFSSRCIDGWWQGGDVAPPLAARMHDLSDGFVIPGPFAASGLTPPASTDNVQLRSLDGETFVELTPAGDITAKCPGTLTLDAPQIVLRGNITTEGQSGPGTVDMRGAVRLDGTLTSTGDQVAAGISQTGHTHTGVQPGGGNTGRPQ